MIGRHANAATRASEARRIRAIGAGAGTLTFASLTALVIVAAVDNAPSVHADELPQPPEVTEPAGETPAGEPAAIFNFADVQPWDPGKNGENLTRTTARVQAAQTAAERVKVAGPVTQVPPGAQRGADGTFGDGCETPGNPVRCNPAPPKDDPLTDDGEFGDGCEQPGTRERCAPKPPIVGLPEVEPTPVDEAEEPPAEEVDPEPIEDEPVVGLPEIVVETEVAE